MNATPYAAAALAGECSRVAALPCGTQGEGFNVAALLVGGFVKAGELPATEARAALMEAGSRMRNQRGRDPWTRDALLAQINRAFRDARPRATPDGVGKVSIRRAPVAVPMPEPEPCEAGAEEARGIAQALRIVAEARPGADSPVQTYFAARGIPWSDDFADDLKYHPACPRGRTERLPAMVARLRDARTGEPCGVHRTYLRPDGAAKAGHGKQKMMLGRARGAVVMLTPFAEVTRGLGIAEGIETAASVLARGWAPVWATGSAGNIEAFPVLCGVEHLTVFADQGERGVEAATRCAERWMRAPERNGEDWRELDTWLLGAPLAKEPPRRREARIIAPRNAGDWNDVIRENSA